MMDPEELAPKTPKTHVLGADLSRHSVAELEALGEALGHELDRVREAIVAKQSSRAAAQAIFKR